MGSCGKVLLITIFGYGLVRISLKISRNSQPPDTSLQIGAPEWISKLRNNLEEHGYAHVVNLVNRSEAEALRMIADGYCFGNPRKANPLFYGGYSVPAFLDIPEFAGARWLVDDPRVHTMLQAVFGGDAYRFASHNDVGCNFVGVWHKDILRDAESKFQECDVWSPDAEGERHHILKVMFYLQDHDQDENAIKIIPGSHVLRRTPWEKGYVALHPKLGDAVIFDQRISHAGNAFYDPFSPGRLFIQVGFGRNNRFTDEFERGTKARQDRGKAQMLRLQENASKSGNLLTDLKMMTIAGFLNALPPQIVNRISDADVKKHVDRKCTGGTAPSREKMSEL